MSFARIISIMGISLGLAACTHSTSEPPHELPVVRTQPVTAAATTAGVRYSAIVRANRQVELDFKLSGYVRQLGRNSKTHRPLQEGDGVAAGTVLASLDPADYSARLETARAAVLEAEVAKKQAERDQNRAGTLVSTGAVTPVELEMRTTQTEAATARLSRAEATLHEAELTVSDTTLRAPFSGTILNRLVEQGAFVTARTPGYVLADTTSMKIVFGVPDVIAQNSQLGQTTTVEVPSLNKTLQAPITRISPAADPRSRLFELEVTLPNASAELKVGLAATVSVDPGNAGRTGKMAPLRALVNGTPSKSEFALFVLDNNQQQPTVHSRPVTVVGIIGDDALLTGLQPNDQIVTLGASLLHDGDRVRLAQ